MSDPFTVMLTGIAESSKVVKLTSVVFKEADNDIDII